MINPMFVIVLNVQMQSLVSKLENFPTMIIQLYWSMDRMHCHRFRQLELYMKYNVEKNCYFNHQSIKIDSYYLVVDKFFANYPNMHYEIYCYLIVQNYSVVTKEPVYVSYVVVVQDLNPYTKFRKL